MSSQHVELHDGADSTAAGSRETGFLSRLLQRAADTRAGGWVRTRRDSSPFLDSIIAEGPAGGPSAATTPSSSYGSHTPEASTESGGSVVGGAGAAAGMGGNGGTGAGTGAGAGAGSDYVVVSDAEVESHPPRALYPAVDSFDSVDSTTPPLHQLQLTDVDQFGYESRSPNCLPRIPEESPVVVDVPLQGMSQGGDPHSGEFHFPGSASAGALSDMDTGDRDREGELQKSLSEHLPGAGSGQGHTHYPTLVESGSHGSLSPRMMLHAGSLGSSPLDSPFSSRASSEVWTPPHPYMHPKGEKPTAILPEPSPSREAAFLTPAALSLPHRFSGIWHYRLMRVLCLLAAGTGFLYLFWKTLTIAEHLSSTSIAGYILLVSEILLYGCSIVMAVELSCPPRDRPATLLPAQGPFPHVAIFICCCREPVDIIADTVRGALGQYYPPSRYCVYVLDDGSDDKLESWVRNEAIERYGTDRLKYIRRQKAKGVPHFFKAGNINNGLTLLDDEVEFVGIFDADMIPSRYFLLGMLPHFSGPDVAFVQCPQSFYNLVRGDPLNDASQDFYDVVLPYRDGRDSAQCIGTGVLFRVAALRKNGGFTVGSITEDSDTSLSLHAMGYKSAFVEQRLQAGLAAWTLEGFVRQRQRWATGNLQILMHRHPLFNRERGISLYRRLIYWFSGAQYYMNFVTLVTLFLPLAIILFDLPILPQGSPLTFWGLPFFPPNFKVVLPRVYVLLLVPFVVSSRLVSLGLYARLPDATRVQLRGDQSWFWMCYYNCMAMLKFMFPLLSRKFEATGASKTQSKGLWGFLLSLRIVWFHIFFIAAALFSIVWSFLHLNRHNCGQLLKVSAWSSYILFTVQCMAVPVIHVLLSKWHPQPSDRKSLLTHDAAGVPSLGLIQIMPKRDWRLIAYQIIPLLWMGVMVFSFYAAISNYRPKFCTINGFFEYSRF